MLPKPNGTQDPLRERQIVYVEYERENGYKADVPGTLDYWRDYLTNPDHSTQGPINRRNPVVRLRERIEVHTSSEWQRVDDRSDLDLLADALSTPGQQENP